VSAAETLVDRTARAAQWRFASTIVGALSRFAIGVLLARLLTPSDFGVVALAMVVLGFAQPFGDLGIAGAVVQRRDLTVRHVRAAFTLATIGGVAIAAALAAAAPFAAMLVRDARVTPILRVLSIGFALQGTAVAAGGLLRRRLDFRRLFFIDSASYLVGYGAVAATLAVRGYGVWSLAWGGLVQTVLTAVAQLSVAAHPMTPLVAGREMGDLLHFGLGSGTSSWINYIALNADNFIVGRTLGAASLGLYARAYTLMNLPYTYAASVMSGVLFPAFAQIQEDVPRLRRAYLVMTRLTALVAAGSMGTMAIAAPYLIRTLYGSRWNGAVTPLQILCGAGYFRALYNIGGIVAQATGQVYGELRRQLLYAVLVVGGALAGSRYGLAGVAIGVAFAIVAMFAAIGQLALRITDTSWREYGRVQRSVLLIGAITCACALGARLSLERLEAPGFMLAIGILSAAAVPWCIGALWTVGDPDLQVLHAHLPRWCLKTAELVRLRSSQLVNS